MAGVYIHIPFCKQACHYCDFHFSTNLTSRNEMVKAIALELDARKDYLQDPIETIYFGGGTPSLLSKDEIQSLLKSIYKSFNISADVEITLEANPEDLTSMYSIDMCQLGINRLSIGIQTFDNERLRWMNRIHSSDQSREAVQNARDAGFKNISLDLIYAIPDHNQTDWEKDLKNIIGINPEHISLYGLTIEDRTVFGKWEQENKLIQVQEDDAAKQYLFAIEYLKDAGYMQYEVSNFSKKGFHSKHNNAYWNDIPYLGVGPGAHSFDGTSRRFNIRNNAKYMKAIAANSIYWEEEVLSDLQLINEKILTQLRTIQGINLEQLNRQLETNLEILHKDFLTEMESKGLLNLADGYLKLTPEGFLVADEVALKLFFPE